MCLKEFLSPNTQSIVVVILLVLSHPQSFLCLLQSYTSLKGPVDIFLSQGGIPTLPFTSYVIYDNLSNCFDPHLVDHQKIASKQVQNEMESIDHWQWLNAASENIFVSSTQSGTFLRQCVDLFAFCSPINLNSLTILSALSEQGVHLIFLLCPYQPQARCSAYDRHQ